MHSSTRLTRHATVRQQQRGIPRIVIDLLLDYGVVERAAGGVRTFYFDKSTRRKVLAYVGPLASALIPFLDYYAIVGKDEQVITVAPRLAKIRHH
ncbi:hypothetical protein [Massilia putida]|uniref:hypothetical protein n=1 Tax=Massilia putida TaxID=1141883 RepID=UPI0009518001|nr:hypothetical protein [Massilia putida]